MINKNKNVNLQLTISKDASEKLLKIQQKLNSIFSLNLTKSQVIEYLINQSQLNTATRNEKNEHQKTKTSAQILALKDKLNISYPRLAELSGISITNLKRYAYGEQEPSGENKILLDKILSKYDIK